MVRASPLGRFVLPLLLLAWFVLAATLHRRGLPLAILVGASVTVAAAIAVGVAVPSSGVFARPILGADPARAAGRFALTFDDGPHPLHTRRLLERLEARGHRATFFVIGRRAERERELVAEIARRGHALGNHSYAHSWWTALRDERWIARDLERASAVLAAITGEAPRWFRPPVGLISPPVAAGARRARLELVAWTASGRDGTGHATVESALARLLPALRPGAILVLHDAAERDDREPIAPALLDRLLDEAEARGLRSVTLDALLG